MAKSTLLNGLGRRIAAARGIPRWGQSELARVLNVSRGAVGQWESGETAPSTTNLIETALQTGASLEWLATNRGNKLPAESETPRTTRGLKRIPLLSWVSAGKLADAGSQIPVEDVPTILMGDLGRGEFFALKVQGDSMDRWSPEGSIIVVNRLDRTLIDGRGYVFSVRGETTYKRWNAEPVYLAPYSTIPSHQPIFIKKKRDFEVVGRVRRTTLDL